MLRNFPTPLWVLMKRLYIQAIYVPLSRAQSTQVELPAEDDPELPRIRIAYGAVLLRLQPSVRYRVGADEP